jgi:hypothetical protein
MAVERTNSLLQRFVNTLRTGGRVVFGKRREAIENEIIEILSRRPAVFLSSCMMFPVPSLTTPVTEKALTSEQTRQIQSYLECHFGTNENLVRAFRKFIGHKPPEVVVASLCRLEEFFKYVEDRGCNSRRLIPLLYTMLKNRDFLPGPRRAEELPQVLKEIEDMVDKGKDPIRETDFDEYVAKLARDHLSLILS